MVLKTSTFWETMKHPDTLAYAFWLSVSLLVLVVSVQKRIWWFDKEDVTLTINVLPEYEDVVEVIDVENKDDEREEVFVKPKIIEE